MKFLFRVAILATLVGAFGCSNDLHAPTEVDPRSPAGPVLPASELLAASDSLEIDGTVYRADAETYRNFALTPQKLEERLLFAVIQVSTSALDTIPADRRAKYVWVVHGGEVWSAELKFQHNGTFRPFAESSAYGGPAWPPGDTLQVIAGIPDSTSEFRLLRCPDTTVETPG